VSNRRRISEHEGTYTFTFDYEIDGAWAAEFDCSVRYKIKFGRGPVMPSFSHPGEPAEGDEIVSLGDWKVEVRGKGGKRWYVDMPADLLAKLEASSQYQRIMDSMCEDAHEEARAA
jgi:hypothetical protein